jgi:hypothetical protein
MEVKRSGSQASTRGPSDSFTGTVRIDPLFQAPDPARVAGASVTFEPGARTAWHRQAAVGCSGRVDQLRKYVPAMSFGFHPVRSIGMAQH